MSAVRTEVPVVRSSAEASVVILVVARETEALRVEDTTPGWSDQADVDYVDPD